MIGEQPFVFSMCVLAYICAPAVINTIRKKCMPSMARIRTYKENWFLTVPKTS